MAWARQAGFDRTMVNAILNGRRALTKKVIKALNLRMVFMPGGVAEPPARRANVQRQHNCRGERTHLTL
jgi:hypothetical protein